MSAPDRLRSSVRSGAVVAAVLVAATAAGCSSLGSTPAAQPPAAAKSTSPTVTDSPTPEVSPASVRTNVPARGTVPVDRRVTLTAEGGRLRSVTVRSDARGGVLEGRLAQGDSRWVATGRLEPGRAYTIRTAVVDEAGQVRRRTSAFRTDPLTLDQQTFPSIAPLDGETVGVGMPVIVAFDVPVTDRAAIERHLDVESSPRQPGAFRWISDSEVHWRPRAYWRPGTRVTVRADINSIPAGRGIYGQLSRTTRFEVGDAVVSRIDVAAHRMRVLRNGELLRTIPISAGKPGFTTRSGTKVIIEKFRSKRMDAATTGIPRDDPEYYNIANVEYALRVTYSGEFLHAAPWSVGSQGRDNVSHGCVGMSTSDAAWLYGLTRRGDVVEVTGSDRPMTLTNGYGDWNASFADYAKGSALG